MNKEQHKMALKVLTCLAGEKLQTIMRAGSMADFGFGDSVEQKVHRYDESKELVPQIVIVSRLALHIDGCFRLSCGNQIVLAKTDMFEPNTEIDRSPEFDWDNFDWDVKGANQYDEIAATITMGKTGEFIIKKITLSKLGDLKIEFENGFLLETFTDRGRESECWRFFEVGSDSHLVMTGQGLQEEE